jgi:FAD/FMN-containing dehydrogenase
MGVSSSWKTYDGLTAKGGPNEPSGANFAIGSRLLSREKLLSPDGIPALEQALNETLSGTAICLPYPNVGGAVAANANISMSLNPAWRTASLHFICLAIQTSSNQVKMAAAYTKMTWSMGLYDSLSEGKAAYVNEANVFEPTWKTTFWGSNYEKLAALKKQFDPNNILWCRNCVGSDVFVEDQGRLYVA